MSRNVRFALALMLSCGVVLGGIGVTALLAGTGFTEAERALIAPLLRKGLESLAVASLVLLIALAFLVRAFMHRYVDAPAKLAEDAQIMLAANPSHRAPPRGSAEIQRLAASLNSFAEMRESLLCDVEARVREAKGRVEQERNRLAALMSELAQSVIVCNIEGSILLYNARAMHLLRQPQRSGGAAAKVHSLVGLGRSIFAVFDRNLIIHALDIIHDRLRERAHAPVANFVATTPAGQLVRVQMAPVLGAESDGVVDASRGITGFVLVVDNITRRIESGNRRALLLQTLTQGTRASLASMRAAVETIASFPEMGDDARDRFVVIIGEEAQRLSAQLDEASREFADSLRTEWPLEDMRGADLIAAVRRRIESGSGVPTKLENVDESLWLKVDSYSLMQAINYLVNRLCDEFGVREIRFGLETAGQFAHLDLIWTGAPLGFETRMSWQTDPMAAGGEASPLTLKQIVERHNAEIWYQIDKPSQREYFRIAIPLTQPDETTWSTLPATQSRPEFYDFDLFHQPGQTQGLDTRPLSSLNYTVFDTETTGLEPSAGDEIVSIGAVRIVNGRLLAHEAFEQLIDPRRPMSATASEITGIDDAMLENQPTIDKVLPAFRTFCEDTVLVAHNAAFDMRFLHLKEEATGVRFTQPVLDTLLLSAVINPQLDSHALEAIAQRMGINPIGRHTALGDAVMTGEIFLRMIPLLAQQGIRTLGEAREASQGTYLARIDY
jgi:DNA polymerase-3 subunit epsilon